MSDVAWGSARMWLFAVWTIVVAGCQVITGLDNLAVTDAGETLQSPSHVARLVDADGSLDPSSALDATVAGAAASVRQETTGSGECAPPGSDRRDCTCEPKLAAAPCDLIEQCGCAKGSACVPISSPSGEYSAMCVPWTGSKQQSEACAAVEDCAPGHLCRFNGLCTRLCDSDAQCSQGRCVSLDLGNTDAGSDLKSCAWSCDRAQPACGANAQCARFDGRFEVQGDFCIKPLAECFELDGVCDEARGSGVCAEGSDPIDCCQPSLPGGQCNLTTQCGCERWPGTSCFEATFADGSHTTACVAAGPTALNHWCRIDTDCRRGSGCFGNVCRPYCDADTDCDDGGRCVPSVRNGVTTEVRACLGPCSPVTNAPCGPNTRCIRGTIEEGVATGCTFVPLTTNCPVNNGRCDEAEGTRLCAEGSDPMDCR